MLFLTFDDPMAKDSTFKRLNFESIFAYEVEGIINASNQALEIHRSKNIVASGNQLEIALRNFFIKKLPANYYVSNGHIIDKNLLTSPQIDIIFCDNVLSPLLYKTFDGNEYLTYESIYAIGEIKRSWKKQHLQDCIDLRKGINSQLNREKILPNEIKIGNSKIALDLKITNNPVRNPLFDFLFVANSTSLRPSHLKDLFNDENHNYLPNIICFLDKGIFINIDTLELKNGNLKVNLYPSFLDEKEKERSEWAMIQIDNNGSLAALYYMLLEHLNYCQLSVPNMIKYMQHMLSFKSENIDLLSDL